jgi:hypothetical protein
MIERAGGPETVSRHFLLALENAQRWGAPGSFLNLGLGLAGHYPVSPNSQIRANSVHPLDFHSSQFELY